MRSLRRSVESSIEASSSLCSSGVQVRSVCRRLDTDALIPASGVRRSWLTAARSADRTRSVSASWLAWAACSLSSCSSAGSGGRGGEGAQQAPVLGEQLGAVRHQGEIVARRDRERRLVRRRTRPTWARTAPPSARPDQRHRGHPEQLLHLLQDALHRGCAGLPGGQPGEQPGLHPVPLRADPVPGAEVDGQADQRRDDHEDDQLDEAVLRLHLERVVRRRQEPVGQQEGRDGGQERDTQQPPTAAITTTTSR